MPHQGFMDRRLGEVSGQIADLVDLVGKALDLAVDGLITPRPELGIEARAIEDEVDRLDGALERDCQDLMALRSPLAGDLMRLITSMRLTLIIEDIGDQAESIARRGRYLALHHLVERPPELLALAETVRRCFRRAVALIDRADQAGVQEVFALKAEAFAQRKAVFSALAERIRSDGEHSAEWSHLLRAAERLAGIADHGKELAEEAWFLHHRVRLRHHHEQLT